jgi:hypothetical protein
LVRETRSMSAPTKNARRDSIIEGQHSEPVAFQEKQRGLFSFLTWPFVLAQALAAQEVLAANLKPLALDEEEGKAKSPRPDGVGTDGDLALSGRRLNGPDEPEATQTAAGSQDAFSNQLDFDVAPSPPPRPDDGADFMREAVQDVGGSAGGGQSSPARVMLPNANDSGTRTDVGEENGAAKSSAVGTASAGTNFVVGGVAVIDSVVDAVPPLLGTTTGAVAKVAGAVLEPLNPVVETVVPVLTSTVKAVTDLSSGIAAVVEPLVDGVAPALITTTGALTELATSTLESAESIVEPVASAVITTTDTVTDLAAKAIEVVAPIGDSLAPVLSGAAEVATELAADAVGTVTPLVEAAEPVLSRATEAGAELAAEVVETVASPSEAIAPVLSSAPAAVTPVAAEAGETVETIIAPTASVLTAASEAASLVASPAEIAPDEQAPAASVAGTSLAAPPLEKALTEDGMIASGGTIEIEDGPALTSAPDDLFAEGRYTDYGITLAVPQPAEAVPVVGADESAVDTPAPQPATQADAPEDGEVLPPQAADDMIGGEIAPLTSVDFISTFDDAGLR